MPSTGHNDSIPHLTVLDLESNHLRHVIKVVHCHRKSLVHGRPASCTILVVAGVQDTGSVLLLLRAGDQLSRLETRYGLISCISGNNKQSDSLQKTVMKLRIGSVSYRIAFHGSSGYVTAQ